jgi:hypothetical protein
MASSNTNVQLTDLDFGSIKNNFIAYLQNQDAFKDYNFEGSSMSVLLDLLAYNTQYNAYYLNMVANEMFLDTALQRSSVVSQAKVLDYTPKSAIAPSAFIKFTGNSITSNTFTLPKFTNFLSEAIDGINYNFVTTDTVTVATTAGTAVIDSLEIKQGLPATYRFTVDSTTNPKYTFEIPDTNVDTTSIQVIVQESVSNSFFEIYKPAQDYLALDSQSKVYFLQESLNGNYELMFGNGVLGKKLSDGNLVITTYVSTQGSSAAGANNFVLMDSVTNLGSYVINPIVKASKGGNKESIDSIKFQAPKSYAAQNRAVTKEDYISLIQQNKLGISFDAVNVWGGEQNEPPVYGQVFVALKPTGGYSLTETQKQKLISDVIKPISVMTVEPTIVEPDYTYIQITANVLYDAKRTNLTSNGISSAVTTAINNFAQNTLNTFNSTFSVSDLIGIIQNSNQSIITNEVSIKLQKKFYPSLVNPTTYNLYFNVPIQKGNFLSGISSSPAIQYYDNSTVVDGVFLEEIPASTQGVESISILNPGYSYQSAPIVTINGDGTGATAEAVINNVGSITAINVTNPGNNYTTAYATITPVTDDHQGQLGAAVVNLQGRYGTLRLYRIDGTNGKVVVNPNIGTVDYTNGVVTLTSFNPSQIDNALGQFTVAVNPTTTIVSSSYNRIITVDPYDSNAVIVNVTAKTS